MILSLLSVLVVEADGLAPNNDTILVGRLLKLKNAAAAAADDCLVRFLLARFVTRTRLELSTMSGQ